MAKQRNENDRTKRGPELDRVRNRSASEVLGILEPTRDEPPSILTMGLWKMGEAPRLQGALR